VGFKLLMELIKQEDERPIFLLDSILLFLRNDLLVHIQHIYLKILEEHIQLNVRLHNSLLQFSLVEPERWFFILHIPCMIFHMGHIQFCSHL